MPKRIFRSSRVRWALLIFAGYWLIALFVNPIHLAQVLTIILIFVALGVVRKYGRQVWESVVSDDHGAISQLAQGIMLAFTGLLLGLIWSITARVVPGAEWMTRHPVVGFYLLCYVVAGSLHMTARRGVKGKIHEEDLRDVLVAYGVGLTLSIILMTFQLGGFLRTPS